MARATAKLTKSRRLAPDKEEEMGKVTRFAALITFAIGMALGSTLATATTQVGGTVVSVSIYSGAIGTTGAEVIISPALPNGTEGCTYSPANTLYIDFSSTAQ